MDVEARIGTVLRGKWTLERLLGSGGMAAVYVGVHKIGRRDAIKILHPHIAREPQLRARFDQEAYAVNRFVHPGAVEIRDIDVTEDGFPFLVMELLEGESLRARHDRLAMLDIGEILRIADQVLDVLGAAHAFSLPDGRIKVLDFGVARVRQAANELRTGTGTTLGTVAYMPPEQVKGTNIDARVDIFALGATMFRLISGRRVHESRSDAELLVKMATQPAPPLASVAPRAPANVCAIVDRALSFDREGRYPDSASMQRDIRAAGIAQPMRAPPNQPSPVDPEAPTILMDPPMRIAQAQTVPDRQPGKVMPPGPTKFVLLGAGLRPRLRMANATAVAQTVIVTLRDPKYRRLAVVAALAAAGVLAIVVYALTRADSEDALRETSAKGAPLVAPAPAKPDPAAPASALVNCFASNTCEQVCDRKCQVECTNRRGCIIGAARDTKVHCMGPERCAVSCAGNCKVKSQRGAPFLVNCAPGFDCEIEDCPWQVERCSSSLFACGSPCPG